MTNITATDDYYIWLLGLLYLSNHVDLSSRPLATDIPYRPPLYPQVTTTHNRYRTGD